VVMDGQKVKSCARRTRVSRHFPVLTCALGGADFKSGTRGDEFVMRRQRGAATYLLLSADSMPMPLTTAPGTWTPTWSVSCAVEAGAYSTINSD
jgi:hypothetical protein